MNAWSDVLTITPVFISTNDVYVALDKTIITGFYALVNLGELVSLEHLWVEPQFMGAGVGRMLFSHAIEIAASRGARTIEIESDPNAEGFYLRMGALRVGESVSMIDGQRRVLPVLVFYTVGFKPRE
jgi:GNAT superfamily N-acetyltransferase